MEDQSPQEGAPDPTAAGDASGVAGTAAAAATASNDDALLAKRLTVLDQLTSVYGFESSVANKALDAVGYPDVNLCYNYILDQGLGEDKGGPVYPIYTCPHVLHRVQITLDQLPKNPAVTQCQHRQVTSSPPGSAAAGLKGDMNADGSCPGTENWLCLTCGAILCSRYVNGHGLQHWEETKEAAMEQKPGADSLDEYGHCVAVSLTDLSVWCHVCSAYIINDKHLGTILKTLEARKFPGEVAAVAAAAAAANPSSILLSSPSSSIQRPGEPQAKRHRTGSMGGQQSEGDEEQEEPKEEEQTGELRASGDEEESENDENEDNDDENEGESFDGDENALFQLIAEAAASQGIPLQWVLSHMHGYPIQDTGPVEYPFENLPKTLPEVAEFILSDKCRRILILAGAGMSVASGIPDFRSADGLYATLNVNGLTCTTEGQREVIREDPSASLDQHLFLQNPLPCLESQREFILGTHSRRWKATLAHRFVELLHHKTGKLVRLYTQNIDGLEDQCTNLPAEKVIAVHGSMDWAECARCEAMQDFAQFCGKVRTQIKDLTLQDSQAPAVSTPILCETCGSPSVKPAIVLFRSSLPKIFFEKVPEDVKDVDLLIIVGTSLKVAPANTLVWRVPRSSMRLLVNREMVGEHLGMVFGDDAERDVFAEGDIEPVLLELLEELGWMDDLRNLLDGGLPDSSQELLRARLEARSAAANQPMQAAGS